MAKSSKVAVQATLAVYRGSPTAEKPLGVIAEGLAQQLLEDVDTYELPPNLIFLLATPEWFVGGAVSALPRMLRNCLDVQRRAKRGLPPVERTGKDRSDYLVPLIGGSMARIFCSKDPENLDIPKGIAAAMLCSTDLQFAVGGLPEVPQDSTERLKVFHNLKNELETVMRRTPGLGSSADRDLFAIFPGYRKGRTANFDQDIFGDILQGFDMKYSVFGCSAANAIRSTSGFQFANDECFESGMAVALLEYDLRIASSLGHGFRPVPGLGRLSLDEIGETGAGGKSHWIYKIDKVPAAKRLKELVKNCSTTAGKAVLGLPAGPDWNISVPIQIPDDENQPVFFTRSFREGDRPFLMAAEYEDLQAESQKIISRATRHVRADKDPVALVLAFPCASRYERYNEDGFEWREIVKNSFQRPPLKDRPLLGGLSAGEFGKDEWGRPRGANLCAWVGIVGTKRNGRGTNRERQIELREAVEDVLVGRKHRDVMRRTLQAIIRCGAEGGQICLVDKSNGRILGMHHGMARNREGGTQNWPLALERTDRKVIAAELGRVIPEELKAFSVGVESGTPTDLAGDTKVAIQGKTFEAQKAKQFIADGGARITELDGGTSSTLSWVQEELLLGRVPEESRDILAIAVHTERAIYVSDVDDPRFCSNPTLARECNIRRHLVIPLPGANGEPIATLQVGFGDSYEMNLELLGYWASFGQKVGQALARAFEGEARESLERLSSKAREFAQRSPSYEWTPKEEISALLSLLQHSLGAEYVSARLKTNPTDEKFSLITLNTDQGALHQEVRPEIEIGSGSCSKTATPGAAQFCNTRDECKKMHSEGMSFAVIERSEAPPFDVNMDRQRQKCEEWGKHLNRIESDARVPIFVQGNYEGAISAVGYQPYLFNERKQSMFRSGCQIIEGFLDSRRSAWEKKFRGAQRRRLDRLKERLPGLLIENLRSGSNWEEILGEIVWGLHLGAAGYWEIEGNQASNIRGWVNMAGKDIRELEPDRVAALTAMAIKLSDSAGATEYYEVGEHHGESRWQFLRGYNSALIVPVVDADKKCLGVLLFANRDKAKSPLPITDPQELHAARDVGVLIALFERLRMERNEKEMLNAQMVKAQTIGSAGLFGTLVVHQLNTSLGTMQKFLDLLNNSKNLTEEKRERWLQVLTESHNALVGHVHSLAERPVAGIQQEELRNLVTLALRVTQLERRRDTSLKIKNDVKGRVAVDVWQVVLGISNVLENALEHAGRSGSIEVETSVEGGSGQIRVRNQSPKPSEEELALMGSVGFSTKVEREGHGMGLALTKHVFAAAGGSVLLRWSEKDNMFEALLKLPIDFNEKRG